MVHQSANRERGTVISTRETTGSAPAVGGAKRILSIDSAGLHGLVGLATLARIETVLKDQSVRPEGFTAPGFRLCDYFDLIGGAGSGALVAAGLAMGRSAEEMLDVMVDLSRASLRRRGLFSRRGAPSVFDRARLLAVLQDLFGCAPLTSTRVRTGLAIMARRVDGPRRAMILSNCMTAGQKPIKSVFMPDADVSVADAVRASLPTLPAGQAEIVRCGGGLHGAFGDVDAGPNRDPSLALLLLATNQPGFGRADHEPGLGWQSGSDRLFLASIGGVRDRSRPHEGAQMNEAVIRSMAVMSKRSLSVDDVTAGLAPEALRAEPRVTYARFALDLDQRWILDRVARTVSLRDLDRLRQLSGAQQIEPLVDLARAVADAEVRSEHFPARFKLS